MEKTIFAGLTRLDDDESILADAGAFIGRDREIIDRLLEIGAKTHRHDGSDGLLDPIQALSGSAVSSAGTLPGDLTFSVGYTLEDDDRGETLISPTITLTTPPVIERPLFAPTGVIDYTAGALLTDTYYYAISYTDAEGGETPVGPAVSVERQPGYANGRVNLSGLTNGMIEAGATGWRLYRAVGGGDFHYLATGVGDTYTDDGSTPVQPDIQPLAEGVNTTNNDNGILLHLPSADARVSESSYINVYMSEDGTFSGDVFLEQFPVSSAGQDVFYPSITLFGEQPPDVNNSIGGASLIDPDTELLDWPWKRTVAQDYMLGSGVLGDVRLVTGTGRIYGMLSASGSGAAQWTHLNSGAAGGGGGGGMGASALLDVQDADGPTFSDVSKLLFQASGGASVGVTDAGGGSARVTMALARTRDTVAAVTASLASGASATADLAASARAQQVLNVATSRVARVRVYATAADRTADVDRPIGTDPVGDHGVLLDFVTVSSDLSWRLSPAVLLANMDTPAVQTLYLSITNMDAVGTVSVTFTRIVIEE